MKDILQVLPPETEITGCIGDRGWYRRFKATAGTARAVVASSYDELQAVSEGSHTPPPWFHEREAECCAMLGDDVTLVLACDGDVRTAPWQIQGVRIADIEVFCWERDPQALQKTLARLSDITQKLTSLEST